MTFAERLAALMAEREVSERALASMAHCHRSYVHLLKTGKRHPGERVAQMIDDALGAGGELAAAAKMGPREAVATLDDEISALEFARHASATDVGAAALDRLDEAVDGLAVAYHASPPGVLLQRVRAHMAYVARLLDGRKTLAEHRRLLAAGGWLSLLAATCLADLRKRDASAAHLRTAAELARETGHAEIGAWCAETWAWLLLTEGDYRQAAEVSRMAQRAAPDGSSAAIQATAQEGRAWARLGAARETYGALARVERMVEPLPEPDRPEHHYRYDPAKAQAYVATTLAWLGDPAAEDQARQVLARLETAGGGPARPRRAATARLDLALALTARGGLDEAAAVALAAITSRLLAPSAYWRAEEVVGAVAARDVPEGRELDDAYRALCR